MREDFCAFILTHGRPDRIHTLKSLERHGYTGKVYLVIDDEDATGDEYRRLYGDRVLVFSKSQVDKFTERYENFKDRRTILWARNACWSLAEKVGCRYFVMLDDDYFNFSHRRMGKRGAGQEEPTYHQWSTYHLDDCLEALVRFLESTPTKTIAMSQGGDHFGGVAGNINVRLKRKAMNSFVCDRKKPFLFRGTMNEDVNTYVSLGSIGNLFFTYMPLQLEQHLTQSSSGGITDMYRAMGTYAKCFYTVIAAPSCVKIRTMGRTDRRLHHNITWRNAVPMIVSEELRKPRENP